jgi:hypothetical protein
MNTKTRTIIDISVLTFLLVAASSPCFAMLAIEDVSTNRAKELGVTIRTNMNGQAGIQVQMEFKTEGELKKITYVELQIGDGENRIMSAPLLVSYPSPGRVAVRFSAYPAYLSKCILTIAVYGGPKGDWGYRFKVKDFVEYQGPAPITDKPFERDSATGAVGSRPIGSNEESGPETLPAAPVKPAKSGSGANTLHPVGGELLPEDSLSADFWQGLDAKSKTVFLTAYRHGLGPSEERAAKAEFRFLSAGHFAALIAKLDKFYQIPENRHVFLSAGIQIGFMEMAGKAQADIDDAIKQARVAPSRL